MLQVSELFENRSNAEVSAQDTGMAFWSEVPAMFVIAMNPQVLARLRAWVFRPSQVVKDIVAEGASRVLKTLP